MITQVSVAALILVLGSHYVEGVATGSLHGVVKDPQGAVVMSLTIEIVADPPQGNLQRVVVRTDQFGKYRVELASGQYKACARMHGFEETCHCVRIEEGREVETDFSMRIDKTYTLPSDYDVMDRRLQLLAGKDAINCGHVYPKQSPHKQTACALSADKRKKPFYVRYDTQCGDCQLSLGLASDELGRVFAVHFDSMGMSTRQPDAAETMPDKIYTVVAPCPARVGLRITGAGALSCFSQKDKVHNIMQELDQ